MISFLRGKIKNKGRGYVIVDTGQVGYGVFVNAVFYADLAIGQELEVYIHEHVREDANNLYGFETLSDLEMFELLLTVTGVGPKSALGITSTAGSEEIKSAIAAGDYSLLTKVSGVGKKTAERIVLELRSKIGSLSADGTGTVAYGIAGEEIDALMALGYSTTQAREALKGVDQKIKSSGERIREALKKIGK
ncbi:MAG: Holliday junction branch migration protein RuvA [Candidatus Falkowbacteria bacterium]